MPIPSPQPHGALAAMSGVPPRWRVTLAGAVGFLVTAYLGRLTVPTGETLALIYPANGVAAIWLAWLAWVGWRRSLAVDAAVLWTLAFTVNALTGAGVRLAAQLGVVSVVIALVFGATLTALAPRLWGPPAPGGLRAGRDVVPILLATLIACSTAALLTEATLGPALAGDLRPILAFVVRNSVGVLVVFPLVLLLVDRLRSSGMRSTPGGQRRAERVEMLALYAVTVGLVWTAVAAPGDLPVAFLVLATSVWAGTRLEPLGANLHAVVLSGAIIAATVLELGGFAPLGDPAGAALVTQLWIALVVVLTLVLALDALERRRLAAEVDVARADSADRAETLTRVLEAMSEGVVLLDPGGTVLMRNEGGARLTGGHAAVVGTHVQQTGLQMHCLDGTPTTLADLLTLGTPATPVRPGPDAPSAPPLSAGCDVVVGSPDSTDLRTLEVRISAVRASSGRDATLIVYHDVTAERRERDALASFAGIVAHDLFSPPSTVAGWTEILAVEVAELTGGRSAGPTADRALSPMRRATDGMQALINDLLVWVTARDATLSRERVDLADLAAEVSAARVEVLLGMQSPRIEVSELPEVAGDAGQLRQVLDNLMGNAIKYVAPGVVPHVQVRGRRDGEQVVVEVIDNGIGIPEDQLETVFDTFHRAHAADYRGTGLGLAIVRRIVERHGGTIAAANHQDGSRFTITLPAYAEPSVASERGPGSAAHAQGAVSDSRVAGPVP